MSVGLVLVVVLVIFLLGGFSGRFGGYGYGYGHGGIGIIGIILIILVVLLSWVGFDLTGGTPSSAEEGGIRVRGGRNPAARRDQRKT